MVVARHACQRFHPAELLGPDALPLRPAYPAAEHGVRVHLRPHPAAACVAPLISQAAGQIIWPDFPTTPASMTLPIPAARSR